MAGTTNSFLSLIALRCTVVFVTLGITLSHAQPIAQEETTAAVVNEHGRSTKPLIQLVVDNDDARRKYFEQREKYLHDSRNGANGHYVKEKDVPADSDEAAPVATPQKLLALLKKRPAFQASSVHRSSRQVVAHPGFHVPHTPLVSHHPAVAFASPHVQFQPHTAPLVTKPPLPTTSAPPTSPAPTTIAPAHKSGAEQTVQEARDEYRKNRFAGSFYALALKLSKAGNSPLSEGGSYSG